MKNCWIGCIVSKNSIFQLVLTICIRPFSRKFLYLWNYIYLTSNLTSYLTNVNLNSVISGWSHSELNSWFNPCGCVVLIKKFSCLFKSCCRACFGLLVLAILSVNIYLACLLSLCLPCTKWGHAGIAFLSNMSDL